MEISSTNSIYSTISSIQTTTLNKPKSINDLGSAISENKKTEIIIGEDTEELSVWFAHGRIYLLL